ncbi:MAG: DUF3592 domain-containing protein [Pseudonocardiaceae bacterium]
MMWPPGDQGGSSTTEKNTIGFSTPEGARYTFTEPDGLVLGTSVTVWYDPLRPSEAATRHDPGSYRWRGIFSVVLSGILTAFGIGMAVSWWRDERAWRR